jgi:membrane-bound metal-dependent hydrolase YbcI (DUF457 family)
MFVGHLAVAFAGKRLRPEVSLGWYVAAATTLDLLWPLFLLAGIEHVRIVPGATAFTPLVFDSYPWSHSLVMALVWGVLLAFIARRRGVDQRAARLIALLVVSHWVLDFVTHAPDMPLWPGSSPRLGLGLWNSIPGTLIIEGAMWLGALFLYLQNRRATDWRGPVALWSLVIITTVTWAFGPWSPPPPSPRMLPLFGLIGWLLVPWSAVADRHYRPSR